MGMATCKWVASCRVSAGTGLARSEGGRAGHGEKLNCDAFAAGCSAAPTRSPGSGFVL